MRNLEEYNQDKVKMQNQIAVQTQLQVQDLREKIESNKSPHKSSPHRQRSVKNHQYITHSPDHKR